MKLWGWCENIALIAKNPLLWAIRCWICCPKYLRLPISNTCVVVYIVFITLLFTPWHIGRCGVEFIILSWLPLEKSSDMKNAIFLSLAGWRSEVFLLDVFNDSWSLFQSEYSGYVIWVNLRKTIFGRMVMSSCRSRCQDSWNLVWTIIFGRWFYPGFNCLKLC